MGYKKLDIEKIKNQTDLTEEEFAREIGITLQELQQYCEGRIQPSTDLLNEMCMYTGLNQSVLFIEEKTTHYIPRNSAKIVPDDTYKSSQLVKSNLAEYIKQGLSDFQEKNLREEIQKIQEHVNMLRKPRISFAGQSDTGKSTLINALLGAEKMPAKWTPTTSIAVYIKHIDDKPSFISEDVWIFGKKSGELWDDKKINDEKYCKEFLIAKGDFSLLEDFGTHQSENRHQQMASSAVAFIDSPLLKNCDIVDLPGFAATAEDDELHDRITRDGTDILLYLSRSNGFLQDRDLDYIHDCLPYLLPVEKKGKNKLDKLGNLFIIASQAGAVSNGNSTELNEILDRRCKALYNSYAIAAASSTNKSLLNFRSSETGYDYSESDFRARFFTYEKDLPRLCKKFNSAFTALTETLPVSLYQEFCVSLKKMIGSFSKVIQDRVNTWNSLLEDKTKYVELVQEIRQSEPARKVERKSKTDKMIENISALCTETKQEIQTKYDKILNTEYLVDMLERYDIKNKKSDKEDFATTVNQLLSNEIQTILIDKSKVYSISLNDYLKESSESFRKYSPYTDININFDSNNSFARGLTSLGVLGASATWLSTSFTAWSVAVLGPLAGWGSILAVGGVIGIALSSALVFIMAVVKGFTWKKDLAKSIIKAYITKNYLDVVFKDVDQYWENTKVGFMAASDRVEKDWQEKIAEYESMADEKNIHILEEKILEAKRGLDFFTKMPMPEIG